MPQGPLWRKHAGRPERAQNRQKAALVAERLLQKRSNPRAGAVPNHPWPTFEPPNRDFAPPCGGTGHCGKGRRNPLCSDESAADDGGAGLKAYADGR